MKHVLHRDYETASPVDLSECGAYVYFEHPDTRVWCCAYAVDDGPVKLWAPGDPVPPEFIECATNPAWTAVAHNASFERLVERCIMAPRYGFPEIPLERQTCTMAMAYAMGLPAKLEKLLPALGSPIVKDMAGHRLMMTMASPRRPRKDEDPSKTYWWDDEERRHRLGRYCVDDVEAERAAGKLLVRLRPQEQALWVLDQRINDRGVYVDRELCHRARRIVEIVAKRLDREMAVVTDWAVTACSNVNDLKTFVRSRGLVVDSLDKEALFELLARSDLDPAARRALQLRQEASKASVKKIVALLAGVSKDGRARGLLQYHVSASGRWGGRRYQPQNLKSPELKPEEVEDAIAIILENPAEKALALLEILYGPPLSVIGDCIRGMVKAAPGKKLIAGDFTSIEAVKLSWLAGEQWKLDAFREHVAGRAPDLYIQTYCRAFEVPFFGKKDKRRKTGKYMDLASGYQGGHGAYLRFGVTGDALAELIEAVQGAVTDEEWAAAVKKYDGGHGLTETEWAALRVAIDRWRSAHPHIKQYWNDLDAAAREAVENPGALTTVRNVKFKVVGSFLWMQLPAGRAISFPYPSLRMKEVPWKNDDGTQARKLCVSFKGMNDKSQWVDEYMYGGKWSNYATQGSARDILAETLFRLEAAGYPCVMHVHDEVICEVPDDFGSVEEFEALMVELPPWAAGLPVAAEAWSGERYRK